MIFGSNAIDPTAPEEDETPRYEDEPSVTLNTPLWYLRLLSSLDNLPAVGDPKTI